MDNNSEQPYVFLPEPTKAPEPTPPERGPIVVPRRRSMPWAWLLIGIPVGIIVTVIGQKAFETPEPKFHTVVHATPAPTASPTALPPTPAPSIDPGPIGVPGAGTGNGGFFGLPSPFAPTPSPGGPPFGPTGIIPSMPPTIPGNIQPLPNVGSGGMAMGPLPGGTQPIHPGTENLPPAAEATSEVALVTMLMPTGEADMDAAESRIRSVAGKFGGKTVHFSELAEKKEGDRAAILVSIPSSKRESATAALRALGATIDDNWQGNPGERQMLLQERLVLALHDLQREREKLLVKYFADATPVKDIDERISFTERQLGAVRAGANGKMAVFRIYVGPNA